MRKTHHPRKKAASPRVELRNARLAAGKGEITDREVEDVEERASPRTPVIYEIVRRLGEEEMARPAVSLWWSGVAAGLSISFSLLASRFSLLAQAILQSHLPDTPWRPLVSSLGYTVGFVMVVLSRQQLFTENTITVVLPVMANVTARRAACPTRSPPPSPIRAARWSRSWATAGSPC